MAKTSISVSQYCDLILFCCILDFIYFFIFPTLVYPSCFLFAVTLLPFILSRMLK